METKEKKFCDFCKYYSYNDDNVKDKRNLEARCSLFQVQVAPWDRCSEYKKK